MLRYLALVSLLLLGGCAGLTGPPAATGIGAPAPEIEMTDARTGARVALADYRGRAVLLNVWATWCTPCRREMPDLDAVQRERPDDVAVLFVTDEPAELVRAWMADRPGVGRHVLSPAEALRGPYAAASTLRPVTFLIDRDGVLRERILGAETAATFRHWLVSLD